MKDNLLKKIVAISLPLSVLLSFSAMLPTTVGVIVTLVGTITAAPMLDKKFTELQTKHDKEKIKEQHYLQQVKIGLAEMDKKGTRVNSMTCFFNDLILAKCNEHRINIDESTLENINQFLYMINANYYERILNDLKVNNQRLQSREEVLRNICEAILLHMEIIEDYAFDDIDVEDVLKQCVFIKDELKDEMQEEFESSKVKGVFGKYRYLIERKDVKSENIEIDYTKKYSEVNKEDISFDIYEKESYIAAIAKINEIPEYQKKGNISAISWDVNALMEICTKLVHKYNSEMERTISNYSIARFAVKLMCATASFALANNKHSVSYNEINTAFKNMKGIPSNLLEEMTKYLENICAEKAHEKPNQKILIFNPNLVKNQK